MKTITIKKSVVAAYKGVGVTVDVMAKRFGITTKEMNEVLVGFGMKAGRTKKVATYEVVPVDDMAEDLASTTVNSTEPEVTEPAMSEAGA
jgi:hypothetical protein